MSELWYPQDLAAGDSATELQAIVDVAHKRGTRTREVAAGEVLKLGTTEFQIDTASTARNRSRASGQLFVTRVAHPNGSALLAIGNFGSAEREGTPGLTGLASAALVIDHPGLTFAARLGLLQNISPKLVILMPGSNPRDMAAGRLAVSTPQLAAVPTLETDVAGAVTVEIKRSSFVVRTFLGLTENLP